MALGLGVAVATGQGVASASPASPTDGSPSSEAGTSPSDNDTSSTESEAKESEAKDSATKESDTTESETDAEADSTTADPSTTTGGDSEETEESTPTPTEDATELEVQPTTGGAAEITTPTTVETPDPADEPADPADLAKGSQRATDQTVETNAAPGASTSASADSSATAAVVDQSATASARIASSAPAEISATEAPVSVALAAPSAAAVVAPVAAPPDPFTSLVTSFLALVVAPFTSAGFLAGGTGTPAGPLGSLLELVFVAQRRVQSFFFNQPPTAQPVQTVPAAEGVITGTVVAVDPDGDPLTFAVNQLPANGSVTINATGEFTYTPSSAFALTGGTDSFGVVVRDNSFSLRSIVGGILGAFGIPADTGTPVTVRVTVLPASPPAAGPLVFAVNTDGNLVTFTPTAPQTLLSSRAIAGLAPGEAIVGIDFRPANGQLYALSTAGKLYTLNQTTGAASLASTLAADPTDPTAPFATLTGGATFGIDFNPVPDRLRVVEDIANLRINVDNGATFTDSDLAPLGDYFAAAYTNSFPMPPNTALYAIDATANTLVVIGAVPAVAGACPGATGNPNCGVVNTIGLLNVDVSNVGGFDIAGRNNEFVLAALQPNNGGASTLYSINLATGAATPVGLIGNAAGAPVTGLAIRAS